MPYDERLAERIRALLVSEPGLTERRMFGGVAFMLNGNMAVGVSHAGGILVRVPPEEHDTHLGRPHVEPMEMRGRPMRGWLRVAPEGLRTARALEQWVTRGREYALSLASK